MSEYLRPVYTPPVADNESLTHFIDIVFVHGLNPNSKPDFANSTWTHETGNFWPEKQLPECIPSARILIFSYNSQVAWAVSTNGIQEHSNNLLDRLSGARKQNSPQGSYTPPIIFVAHSLGGLVVKQALITAKNNDEFKEIRDAVFGLVFFAVPHRGGHGASLGAIAKNIVVSLTGESRNDLVESLEKNSLFLESQANLFKHQLEDYRIVSVFEDRKTKLLRGILRVATNMIIVDQKSATLGLAGTREKVLAVNSNHSDVCKFESDDDKFDPIKRAIKKLADDAVKKENDRLATVERPLSHQSASNTTVTPHLTAPIHPVFGEVVYQPGQHYNTLQLGYFHAEYQLGSEFSSRDSAIASESGKKIINHCLTGFLPFDLPDGIRFSVDDLKVYNFLEVTQKIKGSHQLFFALLGWAGFMICGAKFADDEGRAMYQKARNALSCLHHVDFGGVENAIAVLKEINVMTPWELADKIIQRQRTTVQM